MSLGKYYKRLGLLPGADQAAIRKAYRKLAMRYHPDKNPNASAQAKFILITEAYEILTGKKTPPVQRISRAKSSTNRPTTNAQPHVRKGKTQEDRVREAKERQEEQDKREFEENERFFRHLTTGWRWRIMRWSAIIGIVLSIGLIVERFLPHHFKPDQVTHYCFNPGVISGQENISIIQTERDETYWVSRIHYDLFGRHTRIYVRSSWLFHQPIELMSIGKVNYRPYPVHFSFYSNFILLILAFLLPSVTLIMKNRTITFTIIYQTSFYGVNILMLYFLFRNDQWAHFLTLGFL